MKRTKRTVILLYPDYMNDDGNSTFTWWTNAPTYEGAVENARKAAVRANKDSGEVEPEDFALIGVIDGWHEVNCYE
jgi:hypothetical protein